MFFWKVAIGLVTAASAQISVYQTTISADGVQQTLHERGTLDVEGGKWLKKDQVIPQPILKASNSDTYFISLDKKLNASIPMEILRQHHYCDSLIIHLNQEDRKASD